MTNLSTEGYEQINRLTRRLILFSMVAIILCAPIVRGGNRQVALAGLLGLSLVIVAAVLAEATVCLRRWLVSSDKRWRGWFFWGAILIVAGSPLWFAVLQLTPIDATYWASLPGRSAYLPALPPIGVPQPEALSISLNPDATRASLLAGVPLVAALLAGLWTKPRDVPWLFSALVASVGLQVLVSLVQFAQGAGSLLYFDTAYPQSFIGTFNNRNHLANLLAMTIPVWFSILASLHSDERSGFGGKSGYITPLWYMFGFGVVVMLLATQSRGGLLAAGVALLFSTVIFIKGQELNLKWRHILGLLVLLALCVAAGVFSVGSDHVTERFASTTLLSDAAFRSQLAASTMEAAAALWPWGSGAGTFESVFPRFQHLETVGYASYAHNDYAQWMMEFGAPGVLLAILVFVLIMARAVRLFTSRWRQGYWRIAELQQCFAGVGVVALLIHCWVEFNLHIPALAIIASLLLGICLRPESADRRH